MKRRLFRAELDSRGSLLKCGRGNSRSADRMDDAGVEIFERLASTPERQ